MRTPAIFTLLLVALAACASNRANTPLPFFPQAAPQPPGLEEIWLLAAYRGEVIVEKGCVKLRSAGGARTTTMLWYQGIELAQDEAGLFLRGGPGGKITRFNTLSDFGGGEAQREHVERDYPEVARRCGPPYAYGYPANVYDTP